MNITELSIIIATRNRENILWPTLNHCIRAVTGKNVEVIVVNDGDEEIKPPEELAVAIRFVTNPKKGVSAARNFGASIAKGDMLLFIDDDMWINGRAIDWIFQFVIGSEKNRTSVYILNWQYPDSLNTALTKSKIGKFILNANYNCMWGRMKEKGLQPVSGLYRCSSIASCSFLIDKNMFNDIGGYKEAFIFQGEDIEMSQRLNSLHITIYAVFDVLLFHNHQDRLEIGGFLKRINEGYKSEFDARSKGLLPQVKSEYTGNKKIIFKFIKSTEVLWLKVFSLVPNAPVFSGLNIRLVGMLASLQKYKHSQKVNNLKY